MKNHKIEVIKKILQLVNLILSTLLLLIHVLDIKTAQKNQNGKVYKTDKKAEIQFKRQHENKMLQ